MILKSLSPATAPGRAALSILATISFFGVLFFLSTVPALSPVATLDYASYRGTLSPEGVAQFLGMRYATAPVGNLRFAPPQDPPATLDVQEADQYGPICLETGRLARPLQASEDCLFINVFRPAHSAPDVKLPVYVFIQGGGFNANANANYDGRGLVQASGHQIVVVTFNYRVGPYGFLAGREIQNATSAGLNNGLHDQRKALQWVQKYIAHFGGDPAHVVLGGDSAGATSIALHMTAYGGRQDDLFVAAAAESVSFATMLTVDESQYQYDNLVLRLGCADPSHNSTTTEDAGGAQADDTLACLRSRTAAELQAQSVSIPYPGADHPPLFMWNPVLDGDLIRNYTYAAFDTGAFLRVPVIFGDVTNGGTVFTPRATSSLAQSNSFLRDHFPYVTAAQLHRINALYPNQGPEFPHAGSWWRQVSNAYGDLRYMCPNLFISSAMARYGVRGNWNYRYDVHDPAQVARGLGVPHTAELGAIWGPNNVRGAAPPSYLPGRQNAWVVPFLQAYWVSFIRTLDPNVHRRHGAPVWEELTAADSATAETGEQDWSRMLFDDTEAQSGMETVSASARTNCRYLNQIGLALRQ